MRYHPRMRTRPSPLEPADAARGRSSSGSSSPPPLTSPSTSVAADETVAGDDVERPPPDRELGRGDQVGRYLLLDPLGRGAMGQVLRAYDPDLDRQVAIKILHERGDHGPDLRERLLREAKAMARIHHPHVVSIYDAGMHEGAVFIAMEIVDGPSLDRWLMTPRSRAEILDVLTGAARGLAAAHAAGVIHRDFKPANVLVTEDGRAKVGDFGLAGTDDATKEATSDAKARARAMGTPAYMSPEHFAGVGIDARSDQFSFAIALHEALHGARPFSATTWPELAIQIHTGDVVSTLATRRGGIDGIIRRALAVKPEQRFESMDAVIAALERARRPAWHRWAGAGAVMLAVGLLALGRTSAAEPCETGAQRVEAFWGPSAKAALRIGGSDYTEAFASSARAQLEDALDGYATQWSSAHDESCTAVGPQARHGTPAQQRTAQCLDNRLDSLQGLAELAATEPLDAGRVGELIGTLPALEDCTSGSWIPYPSDPEDAARAAELHRSLARIRRTRLMDRSALVIDDARTAVEQARELGEPYLLALALSQQARVLEPTQEVDPLLDEALALALAGGFDALAAEIVNNLLLTYPFKDTATTWRELGHLVAMARGLLEHGGGDESIQGNLALNEAGIRRRARRFDEAATLDEQAEAHFARAGDLDGVAKARLNQTVTMIEQGRLDEALPRLRKAVEDLEQAMSASAPEAFVAQFVLVGALSYAGRPREAFTVATEVHRRAREIYAPTSYTLRRAMLTHAITALNAGEAERGREAMEALHTLPHVSTQEAYQIDLLELQLVQIEGRHDEILRMVPAALARSGREIGDEQKAFFELFAAGSLFVLGRHSEVREMLANLRIREDLGKLAGYDELQMQVALLASLSGAPPPPGTTWGVHLPDPAKRPTLRPLIEIVHALERAGDPTPTVRRARDEIAAIYDDRDINVQILDAWLASPQPDSP
jgi:tetratricopeptide (TPR) repeat protein